MDKVKKTVTTQANFCAQKVTVEKDCIGRLGNIVEQPATSWSACSKSCGGGTQTSYVSVTCELPDERGQLVELTNMGKVRRQACAMHPCAYWGGWSDWSMCSSTCGAGQRQRTRKCEGGAPGTGGCTDVDEYFEIDGQLKPFTPISNGAVHVYPCDDGPCCEFEWSGWSNCCIEGAQQKRLRWKGNECTGEWQKADEQCEPGTDTTNLQQCTQLYNIKESQNQNYGYNIYYGRRIDEGYYTIGGKTYVLKNSGDQQSWFILNTDNTQTQIDVEIFLSNNGQFGHTYYYRFGNIWYKYINNNFAYYGTTSPPFYTGSSAYQVPVTKAPVTTIVNNWYNPLPQSQIIQYKTQNSGSQTSTSSIFYKPLEQTVVETKTSSSSNASSESMTVKTKFPSAAEAPNSDAALFNW